MAAVVFGGQVNRFPCAKFIAKQYIFTLSSSFRFIYEKTARVISNASQTVIILQAPVNGKNHYLQAIERKFYAGHRRL
jgi:hypothetical protein